MDESNPIKIDSFNLLNESQAITAINCQCNQRQEKHVGCEKYVYIITAYRSYLSTHLFSSYIFIVAFEMLGKDKQIKL